MLGGDKPCAMIEEHRTEPFEEAAEAGLVVFVGISDGAIVLDKSYPDYLYTLPGEEYRAELLIAIYDDVRRRDRHMTEHDHRVIGLLLGYSDEAIDYFVRGIISRP